MGHNVTLGCWLLGVWYLKNTTHLYLLTSTRKEMRTSSQIFLPSQISNQYNNDSAFVFLLNCFEAAAVSSIIFSGLVATLDIVIILCYLYYFSRLFYIFELPTRYNSEIKSIV